VITRSEAAHIGDPSLPPPLFGLVLVGGRSSRMNTNKALLQVNGESQLQRAYRMVADHCENTFISSRREQADEAEYLKFPQVFDSCGDVGPMGGILSALRTCPGVAWLIVACDLPRLDPGTIAHLIINRNPEKIATAFISSHDGLPEPLCAIYEPASEAALWAALEAHIQCPRKTLIRNEDRIEYLRLANPHALDNANTPAEFDDITRKSANE